MAYILKRDDMKRGEIVENSCHRQDLDDVYICSVRQLGLAIL